MMIFVFFFFNDTATTEIYTLSLHDALPISLLFYRAWAEARPTVHQDRPDEDRFTVYVGSLAGHGLPATRNRDAVPDQDRKSTRLNSSHLVISYAVFCLKKKKI